MKVTPIIQTESKPEKDYLGHSNQTSEAFDRFSSSVEDARKVAAAEPRNLTRNIGKHLNALGDRLGHASAISGAMRAVLDGETDSDTVRALVEMAEEFHLKTEELFYSLAGDVLVALEHGGLA